MSTLIRGREQNRPQARHTISIAEIHIHLYLKFKPTISVTQFCWILNRWSQRSSSGCGVTFTVVMLIEFGCGCGICNGSPFLNFSFSFGWLGYDGRWLGDAHGG
ncbi:unnamed protein product [Ilex paraguariensis]|uniref:Uncharacterized protein n=1 Tax=Ilex paraguariensis TaxID=185542 RepID=A0ABC8TJJ8_9AQUA